MFGKILITAIIWRLNLWIVDFGGNFVNTKSTNIYSKLLKYLKAAVPPHVNAIRIKGANGFTAAYSKKHCSFSARVFFQEKTLHSYLFAMYKKIHRIFSSIQSL